jgi:hypothetical protein
VTGSLTAVPVGRVTSRVHGFGEVLMESLGIAQQRDNLPLASSR